MKLKRSLLKNLMKGGQFYFSKFRLFPEKENGGGRRRNRIFSFQSSPAQRAYAKRFAPWSSAETRACAFMCAVRLHVRDTRERGANKTLTASSSASDFSLKESSVLLVVGW